MNRANFYASVRQRASGVFGRSLSQSQVQGVEAILDEARRRGTQLYHLAAILAEAYHETGGRMQPVEENLNYSARRMGQVWPKRFPTTASAQPYAGNPRALANKVYGGRLGNVAPDDGWRYRGRGLAQITGRANYSKFGLAANPDAASDMAMAVRILFDGMERGLFTGRKLADYDYLVTRGPDVPGYRYYQSRSIINDDVATNGVAIDGYGKAFERALIAAGYNPQVAPISDQTHDIVYDEGGRPVAAAPKAEPTAKIEQGPVPGGGWLSALLKFLTNIIAKGWRK